MNKNKRRSSGKTLLSFVILTAIIALFVTLLMSGYHGDSPVRKDAFNVAMAKGVSDKCEGKLLAAGNGGITLSGAIYRPDETGKEFTCKGLEVRLFQVAHARKYITRTDSKGKFKFTGVAPDMNYLLVAISKYSYTRFEEKWEWRTVTPQYGTPYRENVKTTVPVKVLMDKSWHLRMNLNKPGAYGIDLNSSNADKKYNSQVEPGHDPISKLPYESVTDVVPTPDN
ncbi:MAG: hypothetical protein K8T10_18980 [Candidatus Eremiobacteraeota bacterium]|nr:hypothetical protein [Candidatus Eremiobacteraeota bacterium]